MRTYDVVIVGGRPAGASLALRLGAAGMQVLIVDQASFPSRPAVSAAFVLPHTLELLDELELAEAEYAAATPKLRRFSLEFARYFRTELHFDEPSLAATTAMRSIARSSTLVCGTRSLAVQRSQHRAPRALPVWSWRARASCTGCVWSTSANI